MITGRQIRAARGLLGWDATDLAAKAGLTRETVSKIENETVQARETTLGDILSTFNDNGVEFIGTTGVQLRQDSVYALSGIAGFKKLMDDVYTAACDPTAADGSKPICISNVDDRLFMKHLGDYMLFHAQRMNDLKNVKVHILTQEDDFFTIPDGHYLEYRWSANQGAGNVPFYVFGDKLAILMLDETREAQITVISSAMVAKAYREQFATLWQISKEPQVKLKSQV